MASAIAIGVGVATAAFLVSQPFSFFLLPSRFPPLWKRTESKKPGKADPSEPLDVTNRDEPAS